jgi:hypothetical protein
MRKLLIYLRLRVVLGHGPGEEFQGFRAPAVRWQRLNGMECPAAFARTNRPTIVRQRVALQMVADADDPYRVKADTDGRFDRVHRGPVSA